MSNFIVLNGLSSKRLLTEIEEMKKEELSKCLRKFYMAARKHDGSYYAHLS